MKIHKFEIKNLNYSSASEFVTLTVPYRTEPYRTVPYRFGTYHFRDLDLKNRGTVA